MVFFTFLSYIYSYKKSDITPIEKKLGILHIKGYNKREKSKNYLE